MKAQENQLIMARIASVCVLASLCASIIRVTAQSSGVPMKGGGKLFLLIVDGLQKDYIDRYANNLPGFRRLLDEGVFSPLQPVFPSLNRPNHQSIATGLYPETHGIVDDILWSRQRGDIEFDDSELRSKTEPVWTTAARAGLKVRSFNFEGACIPVNGTKIESCKESSRTDRKCNSFSHR